MLGVLSPLLCFSHQWETVLPDSVTITNGFINGDNTTELVGRAGNDGAYIKVFGDGRYEMATFPAPEGKQLLFQNLIPLDNGGYFISGKATSDPSNYYLGELMVMILDEDLNVTYGRMFEVEDGFLGFADGSAVMDDDGTIALLETAWRQQPNNPNSYQAKGALFRFAQSGECLNCHYLLGNPPDPVYYMNQIRDQKMMNDPYSGQTIALSGGQGGEQSLLYFDYDFNLTDDCFIYDTCFSPWEMDRYVSNPHVGYWYNANEMLLVADQRDTDHYINKPHLLIGKMNREGAIFEKVEINKPDTLFYAYGGMAYANDSTVYVGTRCHTVNWLYPLYPHAYLLSTELEILGKVELWDELNYFVRAIFPTNDGGCVLCIKGDGLFYDEPIVKIIRFSREDFNPIPCSVKKVPRETIKALAYPNPATDELNIDISGLMMGNKEHHIQITDAWGHICMDRIIRGEGDVLTLGVSALKTGAYVYRVYNADRDLIKDKFVKE